MPIFTEWRGRERARREIAGVQRYADQASETFRLLAEACAEVNRALSGMAALGAIDVAAMRALAKEIGKAKYRLRYIRRGIRMARGRR